MTHFNPGKLSLVIPVFNEAESLGPLFAEIAAAVAPLGLASEIIFVDDGSTDGSWRVIRELSTDSRVIGLRFRKNFGKAAALAAGFSRATGGVVMTLDADLQDDPAEIPRFLAAVKGGADVVSGWKKVRHDPWHKVFPSRVFNGMVSNVTGVSLHDHNCGFKAYRGEVTRELALYGELHRFVPVLAAARGFTVSELVIHHRPRKFGRSKFGARRFIKGFLDLLSVRMNTAFGTRPLHLFGSIGLALGGVGLLVGATGTVAWLAASGSSAVVEKLLVAAAVVGAVTAFAGLQFILTGLLAEFVRGVHPPVAHYHVSETVPPS